MALKSLSPLMVFALFAFSSLLGVSTAFGSRKILASAPAPAPDTDFGFTPMDTKDPQVLNLATFAVEQYNKSNNSKLVLTHVLEATYTTNGKATNYELAILATNDKDLNSYVLTISDVNGVEKLTSFAEGQ